MEKASEELSKVRFATEPLPTLLRPLMALKSMAQTQGLLAMDAIAPRIEHPVFRRLLLEASEGLPPVRLIVSGLESAASATSADEKTRIGLFTLFSLLLQSADKDTESILQKCMQGTSPLRAIAETLVKIYTPFHWRRLQGLESELQDVIDSGCSRDAHTLYDGAMVVLGLDELDNAIAALEWFRSRFGQFHPFLWAFQNYLETQEVERAGEEGLLGAIGFGFLSQADMPAAFKALTELRVTGRLGPFTAFLLGMLYLYHEESVPYDPKAAFLLFKAAAGKGLPLAAEWYAKFLESSEVPAFPGRAVPSEVSGGEVFSADELTQLLGAISPPDTGKAMPARPDWYDPETAASVRHTTAPGWSVPLLEAHARRAASLGDAALAWEHIKHGAVLGASWAVSTVVGAWAGEAGGVLPEQADKRTLLRDTILHDRRSRPILALAGRSHEHQEALSKLAAASHDPMLVKRIRMELASFKQQHEAAGGLSQADIDKMLKG